MKNLAINSRGKSPTTSTISYVRLGLLLIFSICCWSLNAQTPSVYLGPAPGAPTSCNCLNNAVEGQGGQFSQTVSVIAPAGQNWTITAVTNFFMTSSPPPPGAPIPVSIGQVLTETNPGLYQFTGLHVDGQGFSITLSNGLGDVLLTGTTCHYPDVSIVGLPDTVCLTSLPVTLMADNNGAVGTGQFTINGNIVTEFNAQQLGVGTHVVTYSFDAGGATANDPSDPGCSVSVTKVVQVPDQPSLAVNFQVNITFGPTCSANVVPDMVIEGNYPCMDDFIITVLDPQGNPIGTTVTGEYAGEILVVEVMSEAGQFVGTGSILFTDETDPTIDCPDDDNFAQINQEIQFIDGNLSNVDPTFLPNNFACFDPVVAPLSGLHFYQLDAFTVTSTDTYTFELDTNIPGGGAFALYQGGFNTFGGPCLGIVGTGEPLPDGEGFYQTQTGTIAISAMLMAGETYTLLTTSFNGNSQGAFSYAVYSAGNGLVTGLPVITAPVSLPIFSSSVLDLFNDPNSLPFTGNPQIDDNCMQNTTLSFTDAIVNTGLCGTAIIERTFTVSDQSGNEAQCVQTIELPPIDIDMVQLPPKNIMLECDGNFQTLPSGNPTPAETGFPFVQTAFGAFEINPSYVNIFGSFEDLGRVFSCQGSYQFIRRWTLFNNCNANEIITYEQLIQVADRTPPTLVCTTPDLDMDGMPDTLLYSTGSEGCFATFQVPPVQVSDNCGQFTQTTEIVTEVITETTNAFGFVISVDTQTVVLATLSPGSNLVTGIPQGTHNIRYRATDDCNNTGEILCPIKVMDLTTPTAVCDDDLIVSINNLGIGVLLATEIDEGSTDNCGIVSYEIRRMLEFDPEDCSPVAPFFTDFSESENVYCCDVGGTIMVELLVTDASGNTNTCMTNITVKDKTPPTCIAPPPVIIECADLPENFVADSLIQLAGLFGGSELIDGCGGAVTEELAPTIDLDECGAGLIIRRFRAIDASGNISNNSCEQIISISPGTDYSIQFPADVIGECVEIPSDDIVINSTGCESFAVSTTEERFDVEEGLACYKILRTYSVINWCEYDGFSAPIEIGRDEDCDGEGGESFWLIRRALGTFIDEDDNENNNFPPAGLRSTSCDGQSNPTGYWRTITGNGYWKYTQVIKVFDNTPPTISPATPEVFCSDNDVACSGPVDIGFSVSDDCVDQIIDILIWFDENDDGNLDGVITNNVLSGEFPNYNIAGSFPIGDHSFRVRVEDSCGNANVIDIPFSIVDCNVSLPICEADIVAPLNQLFPPEDVDGDGEVDVAASTVPVDLFIIGGIPADCSGDLTFSIHRVDAIENGQDIPNPNQTEVVVTCQDIGEVAIRVYTWDSAFNPYSLQPDGSLGGPNFDFCETSILVQDNENHCGDGGNIQTATVSGTILTEEGETVSAVDIYPSPDMPMMMTTTNNGFYSLELDMYENYAVTPSGPADWTNGVSTIDLILISKHILGVQPLDSPYKIIAADINHSNSVSTIDLIYLRKLILGISEDLPNNTSWRFVDANYIFPDLNDPWSASFPEQFLVNDLDNNMTTGDFIGVKIGDVNLSAHANLTSDELEAREASTHFLRTKDQQFNAGDQFSIAISSTEARSLQGFQFTLQYDQDLLSVDGWEEGLLTEEHVYLPNEDMGWLTVSWNRANEAGAEEDEVYFIVNLRAKATGRLSESVSITSAKTKAEAYDYADNDYRLALNYLDQSNSDEFYLEQNRPNPFGDQTVIGFHLPEAGNTILSIFGTDGKVLMQRSEYFQAGYNTILVDAADIKAKGLLYYKLETGPYTATRKMVIF